MDAEHELTYVFFHTFYRLGNQQEVGLEQAEVPSGFEEYEKSAEE